ncbi:MAG: hypothetical protein ACFFCP_05725 [Promethearchaeota archaeon]
MDRLISEEVRKEVLNRITPTQSELTNQNDVISTLTQALTQESSHYQYSFIEPQGSTGKKQTQLRNAADIDLFVGLDPGDYSEILELPQQKRHAGIDHLMTKLVEEWFKPAVTGLEVTNVRKTYSQHPYLSLKMKGLDVDILGCFDIESSKLLKNGPYTAVDRTVHHTKYVADNLTDEKRQNARILKSFVRACHAYGDNCAVGRMGLTGVSLEIISIESEDIDSAFHSLEHLDEDPIDSKHRSLTKLQKIPAFRDNYVFVIDPTDIRRNIASSFTPRSYRWVKYQINEMRKIAKKKETKQVIEKIIEAPIPTDPPPAWIADHMFVREFKSDGSTHYTVLRDKLHRMTKKLQYQLLSERTGEPRFGESLAEVYFEGDNYSVGLIVENPTISEHYDRRGPPTELSNASAEFRKKHPDATTRDGFQWTRMRRKWTSTDSLFEDVVSRNSIDGLTQTKQGIVSKKVLNVLFRFVLPIESEYLRKMTKVKDTGHEKTG